MGSASLPLVILVMTSMMFGTSASSFRSGWETLSFGEPREERPRGYYSGLPSTKDLMENNNRSTMFYSLSPEFNNTTESITNITAQLGSSVFLPCKTHHALERQVSWVRRRDWHILTSGSLTYTQEERFTVHHPEGTTEWTLAIKYVQLDDAGIYECQIATGEGILSRHVNLDVVVPQAVIPGKGEYHVDTGSTISLDCYIQESSEAPQYIFWYHNSRMINYDRERGGVKVHIDTGPRVRSRLTLTHATPADSGNYTCAAANTESASITVYITEGNKIAAIQPRAVDGAATSPNASFPISFLSSVLLMLRILLNNH